MNIILINFIIAVISSTYNKVIQFRKTINFQSQAELNMECQEIVKFFHNYKQLKVIVFTNSKEKSNEMEDDKLGDMTDKIKKFMDKESKDLIENHMELSKMVRDVKKNQDSLENYINLKINSFDKNQEELR